MFHDLFETPTAVRLADGNDDDFQPSFASDRLLAEIGLPVRAIRELRGLLPASARTDDEREREGSRR